MAPVLIPTMNVKTEYVISYVFHTSSTSRIHTHKPDMGSMLVFWVFFQQHPGLTIQDIEHGYKVCKNFWIIISSGKANLIRQSSNVYVNEGFGHLVKFLCCNPLC